MRIGPPPTAGRPGGTACQEIRRRRRRIQFAELSEHDKARRKHQLATRRHIIDRQDEQSRHAEWCAQFSGPEKAEISARWASWVAHLPGPVRRARAAHLDAHRQTWDLPPTWVGPVSSLSAA